MGREIIVGIYDSKENTFTMDEGDWYVCGRDDFTTSLCALFAGREVEYLVVDPYGEHEDGDKVPDGCKDVGKIDPVDPDSNPVYIPLDRGKPIISESVSEAIEERANLAARIASLTKARDNALNLHDWMDMDGYLSELIQDKKDIDWSRSEHLDECLTDAIKLCDEKNRLEQSSLSQVQFADPISEEIAKWGVRSSDEKIPHRYFPIICWSE